MICSHLFVVLCFLFYFGGPPTSIVSEWNRSREVQLEQVASFMLNRRRAEHSSELCTEHGFKNKKGSPRKLRGAEGSWRHHRKNSRSKFHTLTLQWFKLIRCHVKRVLLFSWLKRNEKNSFSQPEKNRMHCLMFSLRQFVALPSVRLKASLTARWASLYQIVTAGVEVGTAPCFPALKRCSCFIYLHYFMQIRRVSCRLFLFC